MAFDGVFVDKSGKPFPKEIGEVLEKCVTDFLISNKDVDPTIVVDSAKRAGERANGGGVIRQLYSYVKTIIDRDSRRASRPALRSARVTSPLTSVEPPGIDYISQIEYDIFFSELLSTLPELDRRILSLHDYQDLTHESIATHLGITVANSRQRLVRARKLIEDQAKSSYRSNLQQDLS